jgi:predicted pyridoxine 5'-phosphate oxidase superfamily flavin-nucleotide-binding protein
MKLTLVAATLAIMTGTAATALAAGPIVHRQVNQQARIGQGVRSGSLTRGETAYIQGREAALARSIRRDRMDGGGLTLAERTRINHQQNVLSRQIHGLKHNGRTR